MLTIDQILKSKQLEDQTGEDDRDFSNPHYKMPISSNYNSTKKKKEQDKKYKEKTN